MKIYKLKRERQEENLRRLRVELDRFSKGFVVRKKGVKYMIFVRMEK